MRSLIILKGLVKQEKINWVKREKLMNFLVDMDNLRDMFYRPTYDPRGEYLSRSYDDLVYRTLVRALIARLSTGCLVILNIPDDLQSTVEELGTFFGYTTFYHVDKVPADYITHYDRYLSRDCRGNKSGGAIRREVKEYEDSTRKLPNKIYTYQELEKYWSHQLKPIRLEERDSVLHISDLHSHFSYTSDGSIPSAKNFALTICLGDYIDGPEENGSKKLIDLVLSPTSQKKRGNVTYYLEGNHELRLRKFLGYLHFKQKGKKIISSTLESSIPKEFMTTTAQEFSIDPRDALEFVRRLNERLREFIIYTKGDTQFICTHVGLKNIEQLSPKYVGSVINTNFNPLTIDEDFTKTYKKDKIWSIHGHCKYPTGLNFHRFPKVMNIDTEDENKVNYFINKNNKKFKVWIVG